jgi:predicted DCC family thiol-disulfide oxidoreductase YuxK
MGHPVLLYDGVCGLCNRAVQFVLRHDRIKTFRFAPLQSAFAERLLAEKQVTASNLDSSYIVVSCDEGNVLLERSDAALFVLRELGGGWKRCAWFLRFMPHAVRDGMYTFIARHRYQIFGKYESCPIPKDADRDRFIDP